MGRKVAMAIFGGIALFGLAVALVGFCLGGRAGGVIIQQGQFVYYNRYEAIPLGSAPGWMNGLSVGGSALPAGQADADLQNDSWLAAPFAEDELESVSVSISAGYLIVKTGDKPGLSVDGPMQYTSQYENGRWQLASAYQGLTSRNSGFWLGDRELTTTFTLTLPKGFESLEVSIGMGEAKVEGLELAGHLNVDTGMGSAKINNCTAGSAYIKVNMGEATTSSLTAKDVQLSCSMGSITYGGNVTNSLSAHCSMGSINIMVPRPANYGWQANARLGDIRIDKDKATSGLSSSSSGNASAAPFFNLECNLGDIDVIFT